MRTVTVIVTAIAIVAVIPKVNFTIWGTSFPPSNGRVWWQSRPGLVLDADRPESIASGNQILASVIGAADQIAKVNPDF